MTEIGTQLAMVTYGDTLLFSKPLESLTIHCHSVKCKQPYTGLLNACWKLNGAPHSAQSVLVI